jgi:hypothetical protein
MDGKLARFREVGNLDISPKYKPGRLSKLTAFEPRITGFEQAQGIRAWQEAIHFPTSTYLHLFGFGLFRLIIRRLVIGDGTPCGAIQIIILSGFQRPEKARKSDRTEGDRKRNENDQDFHQANSRLP